MMQKLHEKRKNELGVDFIEDGRPLIKVEEKAIREFIKVSKEQFTGNFSELTNDAKVTSTTLQQ